MSQAKQKGSHKQTNPRGETHVVVGMKIDVLKQAAATAITQGRKNESHCLGEVRGGRAESLKPEKRRVTS